MLTVHEIAEQHSAKSEDQFGFMLAFTAGQSAARGGADIAGYLEGVAAHRALTRQPATPQRRRTDRRRTCRTQGGSA
ncbi:hypothetical protein ACIGMX_16125 [Streptomyces aquilus]|uniref:hypothetical protein n=1 Tax=Streptomyces aquilus TaxID=2548456 RepID=UPI0037CE9B60